MMADQRGLSIIEVLMAASIIGVGIVGLMAVVPIATYGAHEGETQSVAAFLAEQKMEELRGARWQAPPAADCLGLSAGNGLAAPTSTSCSRTTPTVCTAGATCSISPDEVSVAGYTTYARSVRIVDCATLPGGCGGVANAAMRRLTVTVTYRPLTGVGAPPNARKAVTLVMDISRR